MPLQEKIPHTKGLYSLMEENITRCNDWKFKTGKIQKSKRERGLSAGTNCHTHASQNQNWRPAQMTLVKRILVGSISEQMCEIIFLGAYMEH